MNFLINLVWDKKNIIWCALNVNHEKKRRKIDLLLFQFSFSLSFVVRILTGIICILHDLHTWKTLTLRKNFTWFFLCKLRRFNGTWKNIEIQIRVHVKNCFITSIMGEFIAQLNYHDSAIYFHSINRKHKKWFAKKISSVCVLWNMLFESILWRTSEIFKNFNWSCILPFKSSIPKNKNLFKNPTYCQDYSLVFHVGVECHLHLVGSLQHFRWHWTIFIQANLSTRKFLFLSVTTINPSSEVGSEKMYINHLIHDDCHSLVGNEGSHVESKKHQVALSKSVENCQYSKGRIVV